MLFRSLGLAEDPTEESFHKSLAGAPRLRAEGKLIELAVVDSTAGDFLGAATLHAFNRAHRRAEVGIWLARGAQGQGFATAALELVLGWAFEGLELMRLETSTAPDNRAAVRLASRLGFQGEGLLRKRYFERGKWLDVVLFGLLLEDWVARDRSLPQHPPDPPPPDDDEG